MVQCENNSTCPVKHKNPHSLPSECPMDNQSNSKNSTRSSLGFNTAANDEIFGQERHTFQKEDLSTSRTVSTIPKSNFTPSHQPQQSIHLNWVYPSEQQYYNAMKRKGYNPKEADIPVALFIHNTVNEEGWRQIREWEIMKGNLDPKLQRFVGRPKDLSPKSYFLSLLGYSLPFDRHDWFVVRNGKEIRYVIDFYKGSSVGNIPVAMHLDVRPALDSVTSLYDIAILKLRKMYTPWRLPVVYRPN